MSKRKVLKIKAIVDEIVINNKDKGIMITSDLSKYSNNTFGFSCYLAKIDGTNHLDSLMVHICESESKNYMYEKLKSIKDKLKELRSVQSNN